MLIIIVGNKLSRKIGCILCQKNIRTRKVIGNSKGEVSKAKVFFKESTKHNQNIQRGHWGWGGGGVKLKTSMGGVWMFS